MFTVGDLAKLTGLTVRALHHYDEIGLCRPSGRSAAGYRLYADADVLWLQQIALYRELGVPLGQIGAALASGDRVQHLRDHRDALNAKRGRLDAMLAAIDRAINQGDTTMQPDDVTKLFDGFDPATHEAEARTRWGETESFKESARRTKGYTEADWARSTAEAAAIYGALAGHLRAGSPVADPAVQALVEQHRAHIDHWFYPCSPEMHRGLGEMYVADPRFTANLDKAHGTGFARYLRDAIHA